MTYDEWKEKCARFFGMSDNLPMRIEQIYDASLDLKREWIEREDWTAAEEWDSEKYLGMISRRELTASRIQHLQSKATAEIMDSIDPSWAE